MFPCREGLSFSDGFGLPGFLLPLSLFPFLFHSQTLTFLDSFSPRGLWSPFIIIIIIVRFLNRRVRPETYQLSGLSRLLCTHPASPGHPAVLPCPPPAFSRPSVQLAMNTPFLGEASGCANRQP